MGAEAVVGGAVAVVVINDIFQDGVGGEIAVGLVHGIGLEEAEAHVGGATERWELGFCAVEEGHGGIGSSCIEKAVGSVKQTIDVSIVMATGGT